MSGRVWCELLSAPKVHEMKSGMLCMVCVMHCKCTVGMLHTEEEFGTFCHSQFRRSKIWRVQYSLLSEIQGKFPHASNFLRVEILSNVPSTKIRTHWKFPRLRYIHVCIVIFSCDRIYHEHHSTRMHKDTVWSDLHSMYCKHSKAKSCWQPFWDH